MAEHVAIKVNNAALPIRLWKHLGSRFHQPSAGVRNDQPLAFEAALLEVTQESAPTLQIFLLALRNSQDLPKFIAPDANRNQHRDVLHFTQLLFKITPSRYTYGNSPVISRLRRLQCVGRSSGSAARRFPSSPG